MFIDDLLKAPTKNNSSLTLTTYFSTFNLISIIALTLIIVFFPVPNPIISSTNDEFFK